MSLDRRWVEAFFIGALGMGTAALHYSYDFFPPFASFTSTPAAFVGNSALQNYACLLLASGAAYLATRTATAFSAALLRRPSSTTKVSTGIRTAVRASLVLFLPVLAAFGCYVGAGYPSLGGTVVARWMRANWERNGENDLRWCGRLFVLLFCWQAVLSGVVAVCTGVGRGVSKTLALALGAAAPCSYSGDSTGVAETGDACDERELEKQRPLQPSGGRGGDDAPGWEPK